MKLESVFFPLAKWYMCLEGGPIFFLFLLTLTPDYVFVDLREKHGCERETSVGCLSYVSQSKPATQLCALTRKSDW